MFRITEQRTTARLVFKLEGRLSGPEVRELDKCWRAAVERSCRDDSIWIDLTDVLGVDAAGQEQLTRMHREGVRFLTRGCVMRELVREIAEAH
jgi:ABC-type transporter Mla MlaB component